MPGIKAAIPDHFIMLFWDMPYKTLYEFHNRDGFLHIQFIFVSVVMEGDKVAVIAVNSGSSDDGTAKITANVFYGCFRGAFVGLGIYVEPIFVFPVTAGLNFFKGGAKSGFHFVKQGGTEGIAQEGIVKVLDVAPETIIAVPAFRNKAVDNMWIPF